MRASWSWRMPSGGTNDTPRCIAPGAGRALRSTLPLGVRGRASSVTKADGTMWPGSAAASVRRSASAVGAG